MPRRCGLGSAESASALCSRLNRLCATLLKDLGAPARDAMAILGHSRITMTLEIYTASGEVAHRSALDRVSNALNPPSHRPSKSPGIGR